MPRNLQRVTVYNDGGFVLGIPGAWPAGTVLDVEVGADGYATLLQAYPSITAAPPHHSDEPPVVFPADAAPAPAPAMAEATGVESPISSEAAPALEIAPAAVPPVTPVTPLNEAPPAPVMAQPDDTPTASAVPSAQPEPDPSGQGTAAPEETPLPDPEPSTLVIADPQPADAAPLADVAITPAPPVTETAPAIDSVPPALG